MSLVTLHGGIGTRNIDKSAEIWEWYLEGALLGFLGEVALCTRGVSWGFMVGVVPGVHAWCVNPSSNMSAWYTPSVRACAVDWLILVSKSHSVRDPHVMHLAVHYVDAVSYTHLTLPTTPYV